MSDVRWQRLNEAARVLESRLPEIPRVALILGSGLSDALGNPGEGVSIPWEEIPGFPLPTVAGHAGAFWAGRIGDVPLLIQRGRTHFYEGYTMDEVVFSTRLLALLGAETLIVTNAAGAINPEFAAGDLVLIRDHINMLGDNPLRGTNLEQFGARFPDMSFAYSRRLRDLARQVAADEQIPLQEGVYLATRGPSYETPAEIRAFATLGADLVGMSTVPEVIVAVHAGIEILGISCATNLAAGVNPDAALSHAEVIETTRRVGERMRRLVLRIVERI